MRVTGNRSDKLISQNANNTYAPLGAFGLLVRWRRKNELLRCVSTAGSFTKRYINLVAGLALLVCHLHELRHPLAGLLPLHTFFLDEKWLARHLYRHFFPLIIIIITEFGHYHGRSIYQVSIAFCDSAEQ